MVFDPGAGHAPEIPADVETVWLVLRSQRLDAARGARVDLERLLGAQRTELGEVPPGRDQQVSRRIRGLVQHDESQRALVDEQFALGSAAGGPVALVCVMDGVEGPG